jgi:hypothetical protein
MEATGKLCESAAKYGIKPSTVLNLWTKYKKTGTTKTSCALGIYQSFQIKAMAGGAKLCQRQSKPFQQIAQDTRMNISEHIVCDVAADAGYH